MSTWDFYFSVRRMQNMWILKSVIETYCLFFFFPFYYAKMIRLIFFFPPLWSESYWSAVIQYLAVKELSVFVFKIYVAKLKFCSPAEVTCADCIKGLVFWQKACATRILSNCRWYPFKWYGQKFFTGDGRRGGRRIEDNRGILRHEKLEPAKAYYLS